MLQFGVGCIAQKHTDLSGRSWNQTHNFLIAGRLLYPLVHRQLIDSFSYVLLIKSNYKFKSKSVK